MFNSHQEQYSKQLRTRLFRSTNKRLKNKELSENHADDLLHPFRRMK